MNIALISFAINVAGTSINALAFAVFGHPISAVCMILSAACATMAVLQLEGQDVRDGKY